MNLAVTIIYFQPRFGPKETDFSFTIFQSDPPFWPNDKAQIKNKVEQKKGRIYPGVSVEQFSIKKQSLGGLCFTGSGNIDFGGVKSIFVFEPPDGHVDDEIAITHGSPWISLNALKQGESISGSLYVINGVDPQAGSVHPYLIGAWSLNVF